jgi:hypothetical protein
VHSGVTERMCSPGLEARAIKTGLETGAADDAEFAQCRKHCPAA